MEREEYRSKGFPIETEDGIRPYLDLLAKLGNYTGMKINVKKCVGLAELWDGERAVKMNEPYFYRPFPGVNFAAEEQWGKEEQKLDAIKTLELPRNDFGMMRGDIYQSDLRSFDAWLRGRIMGWLHIQCIPMEVFVMSWRDGGFTLVYGSRVFDPSDAELSAIN
jgi:hypothetical protein